MKVTNKWEQTSIALYSSTLSGRYKNQCKQIWTFLEVFICGNKFCVFSMVTSLIFTYALQVILCFTLWFITATY